jgi:hypothetical protein
VPLRKIKLTLEDENKQALTLANLIDGKTEGEDEVKEKKVVEAKKSDNHEEEIHVAVPQESLVGKKLSDLTTRKVILIVLSMLLTAPLFIVTTYKSDPDGASVGLELIAANEVGTDGFNFAFENFIELYYYNRKKLILVNAKSVIWETNINPNDLRINEKEFIFA